MLPLYSLREFFFVKKNIHLCKQICKIFEKSVFADIFMS